MSNAAVDAAAAIDATTHTAVDAVHQHHLPTSISVVGAAARSGDDRRVQQLIGGGGVASVNAIDARTGLYPIHEAVRGGHLRCVQLLLAGDDDDDATNATVRRHGRRNGEEPIHMAVRAKRNAIEITKCLLQHGASVNAEAYWDRTPLSMAPTTAVDLKTFLHAEGARSNTSAEEEEGEGASCSTTRFYTCDQVRTANAQLLQRELNNGDDGDGSEMSSSRQRQIFDLISNNEIITCTEHLIMPHARTFEDLKAFVENSNADDIDKELSIAVYSHNSAVVKFYLSKGYRPFGLDSNWLVHMHTIAACIRCNNMEAFGLIRPYLTDEIREMINMNNVNGYFYSYEHPLLMAMERAVEFNSTALLEEVLKIGFDMDAYSFGVYRGYITYTEFESGHPANLFTDCCRLHNIGYGNATFLSRAIIGTAFNDDGDDGGGLDDDDNDGGGGGGSDGDGGGGDDICVRVVRLLVRWCASVNGCAGDGAVPPLVATLLRSDSRFHPGSLSHDMFHFLLNNGADLSFRSVGSEYAWPDVAVVAAVVGNVVVLRLVIHRLAPPLNPFQLLQDMTRFKCNPPAPFNTTAHKWLLRKCVGASVLCLLDYQLAVTADIVDICERIEREFSIEDPPPHGETDSVWDSVRRLVGRVSRLKHICRIQILAILTANGRQRNDAIAQTPLPPALRRYLAYQ